jgi:hypothetical protein
MVLYSVTIFLSAFLLFQIQPLFAKMGSSFFEAHHGSYCENGCEKTGIQARSSRMDR